MQKLLIATNNRGKIHELNQLLNGLPVELCGLSDVGINIDIDETGKTFADNAILKATGYAQLARLPTLADDSGLVIDHLDGRPGVHSARYAGPGATDKDRVRRILAELGEASDEHRRARFVCVTSFVEPMKNLQVTVEGVCEGVIVDEPRGTAGFGYDPIFQPNGFDQTFAEMAPEIKNQISHRALAIAKIIPFLRAFF